MVRRVDPIRQEGPLFGEQRTRALAEYDGALVRLRRLDAEMNALALARRSVLEEVQAMHRRLWTSLTWRGRQPLPDGAEALPPARHDAKRLWGRRLRSVCLALLRAHRGPLRLIDLHAHLHRRGFVVDSHHPVKALADALGYERLAGRVRRVDRGVYELVPSPLPARGRHGNPHELAA